MLKDCTKKKTIPCDWRVAGLLCNAPEDIDCHYAEPLIPAHLNRINDGRPGDQAGDLATMREDLERRKEEKRWS